MLTSEIVKKLLGLTDFAPLAIEEDALRIVIQFKQAEHSLYPSNEPNELVIELYEKKVYFKINSKKPTMEGGLVRPELTLDYESKFEGLAVPEPYEFVIHEVLRGNQKSCRSPFRVLSRLPSLQIPQSSAKMSWKKNGAFSRRKHARVRT